MSRPVSGCSPAMFIGFLLVASAPARAQPMAIDDVPPALRPWIPWALDGSSHRCAARDVGAVEGASAEGTDDGAICVWPGELTLEVTGTGATFVLDVTAEERQPVTLPGSGRFWPTSVRLDGRPTTVLAVGDRPTAWLPPGVHRVEGVFSWSAPPEALAVPESVARVAVTRDGIRVSAPRGENGEVWLRSSDTGANDGEDVGIEVHRRIRDGSPLEVSTRITVRASGRARELRLPAVLPEGLVPVELVSQLPARLTAAGELTLQVRAGTYLVAIRAYAARPDVSLRRPLAMAPWPAQEVWVWAPDDAFRQVRVEGAAGIDPQRTSLPEEWRTHAAYLVDAETTFVLRTMRRGEPTPPPNELAIDRDVWLDARGDGLTARDRLDVTMHTVHRLELARGELGRVSVGDRDQLITVAEDGGRPGIELRDTQRALVAEWRLEGVANVLPAVNWSENASRLSMRLHLPPGWTLIHASGVDRAVGSWLGRWTLLAVFGVLLIAAAVARSFGLVWGFVALASLGLSVYEPDAPEWIWLVLAALVGIHRALFGNRFEWLVRWLYLAVALWATVAAVSFAATQLTYALHPQLAPPAGEESRYGDGRADFSLARTAPLPEEATQTMLESYDIAALSSEGGSGLRRGAVSASADSNAAWLDPNAVVQTGFGVPAWSWTRHELVFDGPVARDHEIRFWLLPPWGFRAASAARGVLVLVLLAGVLLVRPRRPEPSSSRQETGAGAGGGRGGSDDDGPSRDASERDASESTREEHGDPAARLASDAASASELDDTPGPDARSGSEQPRGQDGALKRRASEGGSPGRTPSLGVALLALLASMALPLRASAQEAPSESLLRELRERLTRRAPCGDSFCSETSRMEVAAIGDLLRVTIDVSASNTVAHPLPGPSDVWTPTSVTLDGSPTQALVRLEDGFIHARVPEGAHRLVAEGTLAGRDAVTLVFGRPPRTLDVTTRGWEAFGLGTDDRVADSVQLGRTLASDVGQASDEPRAELATWLQVHRRLDVGVRWTLETTVTRLGGPSAPTVARVPLLAGERVTDAGVTVERGEVVVTLGPGLSSIGWTSALEPTDTLTLRAPETGNLHEVWTLACSPLLRCEPATSVGGLAPTSRGEDGQWRPTWHPWPGESLEVRFSRPLAAEGQTMTVDRATLTVQPGVRLTTSTLDATVRASTSSSFTVELPVDSDLQALMVDGQRRPMQREGRQVVAAIEPGSHQVHLAWQSPEGWRAVLETPRVSLGSGAVNVDLHVDLGASRWVLWLSGPAWGPAVLFWPYLALVVVLAFALARRRDVPLRAPEWTLLLAGLTQIPTVAAVVVVGWFFLLAHRRSRLDVSDLVFGARQVVVVGYTMVAFGCLVWAVDAGLLGEPEMGIAGPDCSPSHVRFFVDRIDGVLPVATVWSAPLWVYRILMFAWALWLALALVRWSRWGWESFREGGLVRWARRARPQG